MYYVIYVSSGNESKAQGLIHKMISSELYSDCFYPVRLMKKKLRGKWTIIHERLIPGYIFIESENASELYKELRGIPMFLRMLGKEESDDDIDIYPLSDNEVSWLNKLSGRNDNANKKEHEVGLSQVGFDENDEIVIISGPLLGIKGQIKKINLHKRIAEVEVDFMNQKTVVHLGIEIIEKSVKEANIASGDSCDSAEDDWIEKYKEKFGKEPNLFDGA